MPPALFSLLFVLVALFIAGSAALQFLAPREMSSRRIRRVGGESGGSATTEDGDSVDGTDQNDGAATGRTTMRVEPTSLQLQYRRLLGLLVLVVAIGMILLLFQGP